jgi:hypothetical protein
MRCALFALGLIIAQGSLLSHAPSRQRRPRGAAQYQTPVTQASRHRVGFYCQARPPNAIRTRLLFCDCGAPIEIRSTGCAFPLNDLAARVPHVPVLWHTVPKRAQSSTEPGTERPIYLDAGAYAEFTSNRVIEVLGKLVSIHGAPAHLRSDNGPEFVSRAVLRWLNESNINTACIDPGKPWQNGSNESFNGKFRDECLSMRWFKNRIDAKILIEEFRRQFNEVRPRASRNRSAWSPARTSAAPTRPSTVLALQISSAGSGFRPR